MVEKTIEIHKNFRNGDYVAVTINPSNRKQFPNASIRRRLQKFRSNMLLVLGALQKQHKYKFNIEISKFGRLHLHGYVKLKNILEFNNWVYDIKYNSNDYNLDIDSIDNLSKWDKYCRKDEELFDMIDRPRIIFPEPKEAILRKIYKIDKKSDDDETVETDSIEDSI